MKPLLTLNTANRLGECVLWNDETQALWWTDIEERRLFCMDWQSRDLRTIATPERLCSFGFVAGSTSLVAAFESGVALYHPGSGSLDWLWRLDRTGQRMNDGRVDRQGRFWAGAMAEHRSQAGKAELICVDARRQVRTCERGVTISNGLCWSPDGAAMYFADSAARTIWRYAFRAADGAITGRRVFAETPEGAHPDGATVDAEGFLWSAQWGAGRVARYAPDGKLDRILELPVSQPTCVAFGGPALNLLFVTSAREGLSDTALAAQKGAGDVFVYDVGVTGLPESRFGAPSF